MPIKTMSMDMPHGHDSCQHGHGDMDGHFVPCTTRNRPTRTKYLPTRTNLSTNSYQSTYQLVPLNLHVERTLRQCLCNCNPYRRRCITPVKVALPTLISVVFLQILLGYRLT